MGDQLGFLKYLSYVKKQCFLECIPRDTGLINYFGKNQ